MLEDSSKSDNVFYSIIHLWLFLFLRLHFPNSKFNSLMELKDSTVSSNSLLFYISLIELNFMTYLGTYSVECNEWWNNAFSSTLYKWGYWLKNWKTIMNKKLNANPWHAFYTFQLFVTNQTSRRLCPCSYLHQFM